MNSKRSVNLFIKPDLLFNINHLCHNRNTPNSPDEANIKQKMVDQKFIDRIFGSMRRKKSLVLANNQNHLKVFFQKLSFSFLFYSQCIINSSFYQKINDERTLFFIFKFICNI